MADDIFKYVQTAKKDYHAIEEILFQCFSSSDFKPNQRRVRTLVAKLVDERLAKKGYMQVALKVVKARIHLPRSTKAKK